ncbi:hypothetical protein IAU60_002407 [Kwoniella sp. DSM 27419]
MSSPTFGTHSGRETSENLQSTIPALSQEWYARDYFRAPDIKASVILSGVTLGFNVIANVLLVVRFSSKTTFWWKHSTRWSLIFWVATTLCGGVNLIVFGIATRNGPGFVYLEGFWCAVVALIDAGIIAITLTIHYFIAFGDEKQDTSELRSSGKRFMLSVTAFFFIIGLESLVYCKLEHWSYADSIYFSTQVALTIGFGDFTPNSAAGKVLIFPFSVLTISQLGNGIAQIIGFISSRSEGRREKWRQRFEKAMHAEADRTRPKASLTEEMALIHQINLREEIMSQCYDLVWSALGLITFWLSGAAIFNAIEGWGFGNAVYSCMILSLTIGFGDYTPGRPAGKVIFIVYALMAVPLVTFFAVQTMTGLLSTYSARGAAREAFLTAQRRNPDAFSAHSDFVLKHNQSYSAAKNRLHGVQTESDGSPQQTDRGEAGDKSDPERKVGALSDATAMLESDIYVAAGSSSNRDGKESHETGSGAEVEDDDPDDYTLTGRRKDYAKTHYREEKELKEDYFKMKSFARKKEHDLECREKAQAARHNSPPHPRHRQATDPRPDPKNARPSDTTESESRTREESEKTRVQGSADDSPGLLQLSADVFDDEVTQHQMQIDLLKQLMRRTIQLEAVARQILLDEMEHGVARTLLLADRNVQVRDVKAIRGKSADILALWSGEDDRTAKDKQTASNEIRTNYSDPTMNDQPSSTSSADKSKGQLDLLHRVMRYRSAFAEILVLGSLLQRLEGEEKQTFERWREEDVTAAQKRAKRKARKRSKSESNGSAGEKKQGRRGSQTRATASKGPAKQENGAANDHDRDLEKGDAGSREEYPEGDEQNAAESADVEEADEDEEEEQVPTDIESDGTDTESELHEGDPQEDGKAQDIERVAENRWGGLTSRIWKRYRREKKEGRAMTV